MSAISSLTSSLGPSISALLSLSLAIALGLLLGQVKVRGIRLGVAGVLFSSLALAQLGVPFQQEALPFVRDLSLVLFVYALGLQVGPGFVASLRAEGLRLNLLAAAALLLAGALAAALARMLAVGGTARRVYTPVRSTPPPRWPVHRSSCSRSSHRNPIARRAQWPRRAWRTP